jgi:multidrug transporter EmrE-like cation transporter
MEVKSILYIVILVIVEILTVTSIKQWSIHKNNLFIVLGLLGYLAVGCIFAYILYTHSEMTIVNSLWQILNIILITGLGLLVYKEKLTIKQYIGVFLAIISTVLLAFE